MMKKEKKTVGALILASKNLDIDRCGNEEIPYFLPMYPLDGMSVIKREIYTLRKAGISPIIVNCGYQSGVLKNHLSHNGVQFLEEPDFEQKTILQSIETGIEFAKELCDRLLIIPVECPAFTVQTIIKMKDSCENIVLSYHQKRSSLYALELDQRNFNTESFQGLETEDEGVLYSLTQENGIMSIQEYVKEKRSANPLFVKTKVVIGKDEAFFGPGVYDLLTNIEKTGSIQAAAAQMNMSYSKCWKMLNKAEEQVGFPFLERYNGGKNGGRSMLTEEGRTFMQRYHAMDEDLKRISGNFFDIYFREFQ